MCTLWHSRALFPDWWPWVYEKPISSSWGKAAAAPCCFLSVLPLQRACKAGNASTSHITGWKEQPQVQSAVKLSWVSFYRCNTLENTGAVSAGDTCVTKGHKLWVLGDAQQIPQCLWSVIAAEISLSPACSQETYRLWKKKNPSSLGTFSPQQTTAFPLSALHPLCQIYRSCIREMGMMGLL